VLAAGAQLGLLEQVEPSGCPPATPSQPSTGRFGRLFRNLPPLH